jgi:hypothetical protein
MSIRVSKSDRRESKNSIKVRSYTAIPNRVARSINRASFSLSTLRTLRGEVDMSLFAIVLPFESDCGTLINLSTTASVGHISTRFDNGSPLRHRRVPNHWQNRRDQTLLEKPWRDPTVAVVRSLAHQSAFSNSLSGT